MPTHLFSIDQSKRAGWFTITGGRTQETAGSEDGAAPHSAVRKIGKLCVIKEEKSQRMKFKPAALVNSIHQQQPSQSQKVFKGAVKPLLAEKEDLVLHHTSCQLPVQGEMIRAWEESSRTLWVKAVEVLPPEPMKFVLNDNLNNLMTNTNLKLWEKKASNTCPLCQGS